MLNLALAGDARYGVDLRELAPSATGYTVDTLTGLRAELGATRPLVWLVGTDQLAVLDTWSRWQRLFELAHLAVYPRSGAPAVNPAVSTELGARRAADDGWRNRAAGAIIELDMPRFDISASGVREALARGNDASTMLPAAVMDYINARKLYRNGHP